MVKNAGVVNAGRKIRDQYAGVENAEKNRVRKACLRISVPKLMTECKNDIGFSSFDTVVNNSCSLFCIYLCVFCLSAFCCLYGPVSRNFSGRSCLK